MKEHLSPESLSRSLRISMRSRDLPGFRALTCGLDQYQASSRRRVFCPRAPRWIFTSSLIERRFKIFPALLASTGRGRSPGNATFVWE